jgi:hypothetical protein
LISNEFHVLSATPRDMECNMKKLPDEGNNDMQFNDDGVPWPDPEHIKKWREAALRDMPAPQELAEDFADLIAAMRWASELDRIGAKNKDLPDRLTSTEYMLGALATCFLTIPLLREGGQLAPLMRLQAAIVDLADGRQSDLFVPVIKKAGNPGKGVAYAMLRGLGARALDELVDSGEPVKQASDRVAKAVRKGRKDMHDVTGETVKNWRERLMEGPRGAQDDAWKHYREALPPETGSTSKMRGETLLKSLRERGEIFG